MNRLARSLTTIVAVCLAVGACAQDGGDVEATSTAASTAEMTPNGPVIARANRPGSAILRGLRAFAWVRENGSFGAHLLHPRPSRSVWLELGAKVSQEARVCSNSIWFPSGSLT